MSAQVRATLVEIWKRAVKPKKEGKLNVYQNGDNNLYPNEIEAVIRNSPTAVRVVDILSTYITGKGIEDENGNLAEWLDLPYVNKKKGYKLPDIIWLASKTLATQNGVFFHVGYGLDEDFKPYPNSLDVLDYVKCRKAIEDADLNAGKIIYKDYEQKVGFNVKVKELEFLPFNPDVKVVTAQIFDGKDTEDISEAIEDYNGQVFYLNLNPEQIYASSNFESVYNDMDTEYRIGLYANMQSRVGFLGKTIVLTQGLDEEKALETQEDLAQFMGAENSSSMYHLDVVQTDDLDKILKIIQLEPQFDDKLFDQTQKRIRTNIIGVGGNISERLMFSSDGVFSASGEALLEDKISASESTEFYRTQLERAFNTMGFPCKIVPLVERENIQEDEADL